MALVDRQPAAERGQRAAAEPRADHPGRLAAVVGLVTVVVVAGALAGPWDPPVRNEVPDLVRPSIPPMPSITPIEHLPVEATEVRPWNLTWLGVSLVVVVLGWVLFLVLRWFRRHPAPSEPEDPDDAGIELDGAFTGPGTMLPSLPELREGVAQAGEELRRLVRPVDAVIAAWVRLEATAAHSGVVRDRASTPTEFTLEVLDAAPVDPEATRTLLELYLRARFGSEAMGPGDVASAMTALAVLAAGLGETEDGGTTGRVVDGAPGRSDGPGPQDGLNDPDGQDGRPDDPDRPREQP